MCLIRNVENIQGNEESEENLLNKIAKYLVKLENDKIIFEDEEFQIMKENLAFKNSIIALDLTCKKEYLIPEEVFQKIPKIVPNLNRQYSIEYGAIKQQIIVLGYFEKIYPDRLRVQEMERVLTGKNEIILKNHYIEERLEKSFNEIKQQHE